MLIINVPYFLTSYLYFIVLFLRKNQKDNIMIYGYCRCSTDKQTIENQKFQIEQFAQINNLSIEKWIVETISSTKELKKRKLSGLLKKLKKGDILIASELSRLGRNLLQVMGILSDCMNKDCQVWTVKNNYRLGNDLPSQLLAIAFSISSQIERELISTRTQQSLARLKSEGKILGRPVGAKNKKVLLSGQEENIRRLLKEGYTKTEIAKSLKVNRITLYYFIKQNLLGQTDENFTSQI